MGTSAYAAASVPGRPLDVARSGAHRMRLTKVRGHSVETELVTLDVLHHEARLVNAIGRQ
jgi:hypothetical protein